jgi:hypothetical protein
MQPSANTGACLWRQPGTALVTEADLDWTINPTQPWAQAILICNRGRARLLPSSPQLTLARMSELSFSSTGLVVGQRVEILELANWEERPEYPGAAEDPWCVTMLSLCNGEHVGVTSS